MAWRRISAARRSEYSSSGRCWLAADSQLTQPGSTLIRLQMKSWRLRAAATACFASGAARRAPVRVDRANWSGSGRRQPSPCLEWFYSGAGGNDIGQKASQVNEFVNKISKSKNQQSLVALYDATLKRLKTPYQALWVGTSFGKTHVISAGAEDAHPVLVLHGSASSAAGCWSLINGLSSKYRVYAPDAPRHLGKTEPFRLSTKNNDYRKWLEDVLNHLEIKHTNVVGFSFGGWMACKLAMHAPERIDKIVLLSPIGLAPFRVQYWIRAPLFLLITLIFRTNASIGRFASLIAGPTASKELIEELTGSAKVFLKNFYMQGFPHSFKMKDLKKLVAPTLLLVGRHDTFFEPEKVVSRINEHVPAAQTEIIEGVGHVVYFEKPEFINRRILEFFECDL